MRLHPPAVSGKDAGSKNKTVSYERDASPTRFPIGCKVAGLALLFFDHLAILVGLSSGNQRKNPRGMKERMSAGDVTEKLESSP